MAIKRIWTAVMLGSAMLIAIPSFGHAASKPTPKLVGGTSSKEDLVKRFLDAIAVRDADRLRALRVNENEYVNIILPGAVPHGQPLRTWPEEVRRYFFREFNEKSEMTGADLVASYGGHRYAIESMTFEQGTKRYANHFVYRQLRLRLKDETGTEHSLATGSIVEIDGKFKFMSYLAD